MTAAKAGARLGAAILLAALYPSLASATTLDVTVQGVRDDRGQVRIGVCTEPEFLSEACALHAVVPARPGNVRARISGIAPGLYAIAAFQDRDGSGRLKRNFLGMPREDVGFSRDPDLRFGPPSFARSAINVGNKDGFVALTLHRFGS